MPWYGDPSFGKPDPSFAEVMARARKPAGDPHLPAELPAVGRAPEVGGRPEPRRTSRDDLPPRAVGDGPLAGPDRDRRRAAIGRSDRRTRAAPALLLLLTFLDLWALGRHRLLDVDPIRPLAEQSPVLARLAEERRGARIASNLGNLPILVGVAPISAYRTLNLPAVESLTRRRRSR